MKTPDRPIAHPDDAELRRQLRESLAPLSSEDLQGLEARALDQWRQRTAAQAHHGGALAVMQAHWRLHAAWWSASLLALCLVALLLTRPWAPADPALDELLQPDVLSLIAAGEL
jgi:hypothetical protein